MKIGEKGLKLIRKYEGCILKAYYCPAGVLTIGYGSTGPHVRKGMIITKAEAEALLTKDIVKYENAVKKAIGSTTVSQEEFDAMVSLCYNIGGTAFAKSSVVRNLLKGNREAAAHSFTLWNKARVNGVLKPLAGLTKRRAEEKALFLSISGSAVSTRLVAGDTASITVPEASTVPEAPKSLVKSKEVLMGTGLSLGSIFNYIDGFTLEDMGEVKETFEEVHTETKDNSFAQEFYIPEITSGLVIAVGLFMVWKRISDRFNGVR